ncbi:unnamed protein product, partial [Allacma fusca]
RRFEESIPSGFSSNNRIPQKIPIIATNSVLATKFEENLCMGRKSCSKVMDILTSSLRGRRLWNRSRSYGMVPRQTRQKKSTSKTNHS